jgi:hypothetical protein
MQLRIFAARADQKLPDFYGNLSLQRPCISHSLERHSRKLRKSLGEHVELCYFFVGKSPAQRPAVLLCLGGVASARNGYNTLAHEPIERDLGRRLIAVSGSDTAERLQQRLQLLQPASVGVRQREEGKGKGGRGRGKK